MRHPAEEGYEEERMSQGGKETYEPPRVEDISANTDTASGPNAFVSEDTNCFPFMS